MRAACSADSSRSNSKSQMIMADSGNSEEVAVICNTDITSTESENNIINTMVERGTALLKKMEISVTEADKRTGKNTVNMQETYSVYLIETRVIQMPRKH